MKVEGPAARRPFGGGWLTHRNGGLAKGTRFVAKGPPPGKRSELQVADFRYWSKVQ